MKMPTWTIGIPFALGMAVGVVILPAHAESDWVLNHCDQSLSTSATVTRTTARAYALQGNGDGYDWGGGCWNGDGVDNTPNQNSDHNENGEGPDCSGFTYKTWGLPYNYGTARRYWNRLYNHLPEAHGPYTANDFRLGTGAASPLPNKNYPTTTFMDAFASTTHIGMIYAEGSGGSDMIAEARDQQTGIVILPRGYRNNDLYDGTEREIWD